MAWVEGMATTVQEPWWSTVIKVFNQNRSIEDVAQYKKLALTCVPNFLKLVGES